MNKSFEDNYKKIEEYLVSLEENKDNLYESIKIYEKANNLYKEMQGQIKDYKAKIEVISNDE